MKRTAWPLVVLFGLALPIGTLVFGWSYASIRETRLKEQHFKADERELAGARSHFAWEMAGLAGLCLVVGAAGLASLRAYRNAEALARERATFVSAVSHELRTPLATMRLHAEMLAEGLVSEQRKQQVFQELVTETARLSRLVENILEASRLGEGRRSIRAAPDDLCAAARAAIEPLDRSITARGFTVEGPGGEPLMATFDPTALEIIVVNLIDNALKYAAGSEPPVIEVSVERGPSHAALRVRDRGPGIPPAEREAVFERFYRIEVAGQEHRPGTGLGLSLVRELARAQGGDARVVDTDGPGTTVEVLLPLA